MHILLLSIPAAVSNTRQDVDNKKSRLYMFVKNFASEILFSPKSWLLVVQAGIYWFKILGLFTSFKNMGIADNKRLNLFSLPRSMSAMLPRNLSNRSGYREKVALSVWIQMVAVSRVPLLR